ncbi:MAG: hypothetical protein WBA57_26230 [Elainellaceae cyanobacterium]
MKFLRNCQSRVEEIDPPKGQEPIRWLLLMSLPITSSEEAWRCVRWYTYRWWVERFHYVLKQGCRMEALQLSSERRLQRIPSSPPEYCVSRTTRDTTHRTLANRF